jgi:hypothetical protein
MKFELTHEEHQMLLLALGMAAGVASRDGNTLLFNRLIALANTVNKGNTEWTPYEVPRS